MIYLARHGRGTALKIAASEGISAAFLERVAARLKSAGLVQATRGAAGGYRLARPAAEISAADIVAALEGPLDLLDCLRDGAACVRSSGCPSRRVWSRLDEAVEAALAGVRLNELANERVAQ